MPALTGAGLTGTSFSMEGAEWETLLPDHELVELCRQYSEISELPGACWFALSVSLFPF